MQFLQIHLTNTQILNIKINFESKIDFFLLFNTYNHNKMYI